MIGPLFLELLGAIQRRKSEEQEMDRFIVYLVEAGGQREAFFFWVASGVLFGSFLGWLFFWVGGGWPCVLFGLKYSFVFFG